MSKLHTITKEQQEAIFLQDYQNEGSEIIFNQRNAKFIANWDFNSEPSAYAKKVTSWARKNILLDMWNQWVAFEEANGEQVFGLPVSETLAKMSRIDQVTQFSSYMNGLLAEVNNKSVDDETNLNSVV
tara:strand:+ start:698 stop:1081 length:384 start_codon:yes stop_codon:yes gene_type:complete